MKGLFLVVMVAAVFAVGYGLGRVDGDRAGHRRGWAAGLDAGGLEAHARYNKIRAIIGTLSAELTKVEPWPAESPDGDTQLARVP
jgi:hypothetical protein